MIMIMTKEGTVLFNGGLNTFYDYMGSDIW